MSITISDIQDELNGYIGDSSTDRVTSSDRLRAITEATTWLQEETMNDLQNKTYELDYLDGIHYYKVTTALADMIDGGDLRISDVNDHTKSFAHKAARNIAEDIGRGYRDSSWAIERRDGDVYLVVLYESKYRPNQISTFDATDAGGGTWELDTTNGDGTNLTVDTEEKKKGSASLNFDMDISQSGNDKIIIKNESLNQQDLSDDEDLSSWIFWAYIPDVSNFSSFDSFTLYWGSDTSNYWSATVTSDIDGSSFADGWNQIKVDWSDASKTSSPDVENIDYIQIDFNYTTPSGDDTDFRIDDLQIIRPEKLKFHYVSWDVGTDTNGSDITEFTATTDVPYFSGQYDNLKFSVAHMAASKIFKQLRLWEESQQEEADARRGLRRVLNIFPSARTPESKGFKPEGVNFNRRGRIRTRK